MSEPATTPIATIASLSHHEGQTVTLRGWLYNLNSVSETCLTLE